MPRNNRKNDIYEEQKYKLNTEKRFLYVEKCLIYKICLRIIHENRKSKYRTVIMNNTANQDTEKVFQTVSVASVERTALAAATEDHV